ncbi:MAG: hypothetical protein C4526_10815 [Nitrospiraceae bacterium]|nr:MAG: hypothetical protein C4526_10815 [Nitrospiraceae bacterium]
MSNNIITANNEWIEVTPRVKVSGPHHEIFLEGVVSTQPEHDEEDIRFEDGRIFVRRRNDEDDDRHFVITYRVSVYGQETFTNTRVIVRKQKN